MNQKLRHQLETTIRFAECLLADKLFHVHNSEINLMPVTVMTKTAAAKKGLVLKRGAKRVAIWNFQIGGTSARGGGDLYLASSFKPKEPS